MFSDEQYYSTVDPDYKGCVKVLTLSATQLGGLDVELETLQRSLLKIVLDPNTSADYRHSKVRSLISIGTLLAQSNNGMWLRASKVVRDDV